MGSILRSAKILNLGYVTRIIAAVNMLSLLLLLLFVHFLPNNHVFPFHYAYAQQYTGATNSSNSSLPILNASSNSSSGSSSSGSSFLSTSGIATANVKPDKVTIVVGVETTNKTAGEALSSNTAALNKVLELLLAAGVKKNETSTSSFSVSPNYNYSEGQNKITGFTVSNSIQIQSSNVNGTAKWIDTAISGGANTIDGINFALSDKKSEEVKNNLIKQAVIDARSKADIAASALGLKIIGVKSVNLNEFEQEPPPVPQPLAMASATQAPAASATPIITGQQKISVNVRINWLIS